MDDLAAWRFFSKLNTLLDHVACKLVLREHKQLGHDNFDHTRSILLFAIFNDVLNNIVSELVRDERSGAGMEFTQNRFPIDFLAMLQHPLNDPTAIRMGSKSIHLPFESVDYKLHILGRNSFDGFLDHVIAILISNTFQDMVLKLLDHRSLLISEDMFQCLYKLAGSVNTHRR